MYEIILHNRAVKFYNQLDDKKAARINRAIETLLENLLLERTSRC